MFNYNEYFEEQYQFLLKEVYYKSIDNNEQIQEIDLKISDTITTDVVNKHLKILFAREVFFIPSALYNIKVIFEINLPFKDNYDTKEINVNWNNELINNPNPYLYNVVSRASNMIANITSSYGQQPLITPPNPILENDNL